MGKESWEFASWGWLKSVKMTLWVILFAVSASATLTPRAALAAPTAASTQSDEQIATLLRSHGIRPVQPPTLASDFRLPDLAGGQRALSDSRGQWVVLTFFATWCGPCRSEMPTLERLHQELGDAGLVVLGVSTDRSDAKLPNFLAQLGITYPNLWDSKGSVGRAYRATSIPISYVIDPLGRIVGVSRGARDWSTLADLFEQSFEIYPPGAVPLPTRSATTAEVAAAEPAPVELPTQLEPPTARWELSTTEPRPGESFHLDIKILWAGNFDEYLLLPPALEAPEGLRQIGTSATSSSEAGRNVVNYRLAFEATEAGRYALDPIELRYTPRFEQEPVASQITGPTVTVKRASLLGMPMGVAVISLAAGGTVLALLFALLIRHQRHSTAPSAADTDQFERFQEAFDTSRRQRMQGNTAASLATLATLEGELGTSPSDLESTHLARLLDDVRYGGGQPSREQLDRIERRVEVGLQALRPDPGQTKLRAKLKAKLKTNLRPSPEISSDPLP